MRTAWARPQGKCPRAMVGGAAADLSRFRCLHPPGHLFRQRVRGYSRQEMRSFAGFVVLAALALPASAVAAIPEGNLVLNGDGESGQAVEDESSHVCPLAWTCGLGSVTLVRYGTTTFPSQSESDRIGGGGSFFAGGPMANPFDTDADAGQRVDLHSVAADIDAGRVQATLSACLGGLLDQRDGAFVAAYLYPESLPPDGVA